MPEFIVKRRYQCCFEDEVIVSEKNKDIAEKKATDEDYIVSLRASKISKKREKRL